MFGGDPTRPQREKARRKLERLVRDGLAVKLDDAQRGGVHAGAKGGAEGVRYAAISTHGSTHAPTSATVDARPHDRRTADPVSPGRSTHGSTHGAHAPIDARAHTPLEGGVRALPCARCHQPADRLVLGRCESCAYPTEPPDEQELS